MTARPVPDLEDQPKTYSPRAAALLMLAGVAYGLVMGRQHSDRPHPLDQYAQRWRVENLEAEQRRIATLIDAHDRYAHHGGNR